MRASLSGLLTVFWRCVLIVCLGGFKNVHSSIHIDFIQIGKKGFQTMYNCTNFSQPFQIFFRTLNLAYTQTHFKVGWKPFGFTKILPKGTWKNFLRIPKKLTKVSTIVLCLLEFFSKLCTIVLCLLEFFSKLCTIVLTLVNFSKKFFEVPLAKFLWNQKASNQLWNEFGYRLNLGSKRIFEKVG